MGLPSPISARPIAALFVTKSGVYYDLDGVDPWDEERDARTYSGPDPVIAHPPCARWSRFAGFTEARFGLKRGDDGGCFESALHSVRTYGGVLEHPAHSAAWAKYDLPKPTWYGGWTHSLTDAGASCYVEQGRYGLPVKKATWLYAFGVEQLPELRWGYTPDGEGPTPNGEHGGMDTWRDAWANGVTGFTFYNGLRSITPPEFRDALIDMARSASVTNAVAA